MGRFGKQNDHGLPAVDAVASPMLIEHIRKAIVGITVIAALLLSGPLLVLGAENETIFIQGSEKYRARIFPGRIALILSEEVSLDADRYRKTLDSLRGQRIQSLSSNVIEVVAPNVRNAKDLTAFAQNLMKSRPDVVVDSGILIAIGESDLPYVLTDKIVVQIADGIDISLIQQIAERHHCEVLGNNPFDKRQFVIRVLPHSPENALEISNALNGWSGVKFAHPNFYRPIDRRQAPIVPNDTFFADQWHLNNIGQGTGTSDADIDADLAWSLGPGNTNIVIAVIDDGLEIAHPDLAGGLWTNPGELVNNQPLDNGDDDDGNGFIDDLHGWDFTPCIGAGPCGDNNVRPRLDELHGTSVAGVALARANNNLGVAGICPWCSFLPIRAIDGSDYAEGVAIDYARTMGAHVISNSWGYASGAVLPLNVVNAINGAAAAGVVVVFAMSNSVEDNCGATPDISSLDSVIAASTATNLDRLLPSGFGTCMDLLAPTHGGTLDAVTTDRVGDIGYNNRSPLSLVSPCASAEPGPPPLSNQDYTFCFGGTSFSAPVVAGIAGLILSHKDSLTRLQVQNLLQDTADKISPSQGAYSEQTGFSSPPGAPPTHGYGRVNAFEAARVVASRNVGGRGGVDVYVRDNSLDWGNTEQPSNVTFEQTRGFIPHWQSVDIKVDAPPYLTTPPVTSMEFDAFAHENPLSSTLNKVYVRIHNRGPSDASGVRVKLHWAFAGAGLPALPADFWPAFPSDSSDTSTWHPLPMQMVASLAYSGASVAGGVDDRSVVLSFDFNAPVYDSALNNPGHYCLFAIVDTANDPVSTTSTNSQVPDLITPGDNNVTHKNVQLLDSSNNVNARIVLANPFESPIRSRLVAWLPKGWKFEAVGIEPGQSFELSPGKSLPVEISITPDGERASASVNVVQLYRTPDMKEEKVLGGTTYMVTSNVASSLAQSDFADLVSTQEGLVAEYLKLVSDSLSKQEATNGTRTLLDKLGGVLEEQSRLLRDLDKRKVSNVRN